MLFSLKTIILMIFVSLALVVAAPLAVLAKEQIPGFFYSTLDNGLHAVVKESHRAPVVAVQVWVKAGSVYETDREAGLTHLIEHMIFKGTEKRGPGKIAGEIEGVGGQINAYTSLDYTVYHCVVPKDYLGTALDVLSDAIFHSKFDPGELEREKKVVLEEIRMREDQPRTRLSRLVMNTSYSVYPYRRPVIGFPETVSSFTRDDILKYMARRYRPCQMSVVVVGDCEGKDALEEIEKFFGKAPAQPADSVVLPVEPEQKQVRVASETMEIKDGYMAVAFSGVADFNSPDAPVLDVLAALLGSGESSRLSLALKDRMQLVHSVDASAFTPAGPGLFEIFLTLAPDKAQAALSQLFAELALVSQKGVSREELERARIQVETSFVYSQETMEGEARKVGVFTTLSGDPAAETEYLTRVRSVTAQDLVRVAEKVFKKAHANVVMVMPEGQVPELDLNATATVPAEPADEKKEPAISVTGVETSYAENLVHPVRKVTLSNGLTLIIESAPEVPTVSVRFVCLGGLRYETPETNGIFNFLASTWTRGTTFRNAQTISSIIEGLGGRIKGFSGQNTYGLEARFLSQNLDKGLDLFGEILLRPSFPEDEVEKQRTLILARIRQQDDYLPGVTIREFRRLLFSPHPYGMNPLGTPETVRSIHSADLKAAYRKFTSPEHSVMAVVGDVDPAELTTKIESMLGQWRAAEQAVLPSPPPPAPLESPRSITLKRESQQTHIVLGFPGTTLTSPDRYALDVLSAILSGQGGRLFMNLRDKESLAYSVTSLESPGLDYGSFAFYIGCAPTKKNQAQKAMWREIYRIIGDPVSEAELERARNWLAGRHEIGLQTHGAKALDMALNELYGLGYDYSATYVRRIREVTRAQVMDAARKYLDTSAYILVIAGP